MGRIDVAGSEEVQAMVRDSVERFGENVFASPATIRVNLNDYVRFRIREDCLHMFRDEPGIKIGEPDGDRHVWAEAQLHVLIVALGPKLAPWLTPPIATQIEFPLPLACSK